MFCFTKQQLDYLAKQVSDIISTDNISNLRTNEDLSLVREDNISTLSFADRDTSKGLAYKILRTESTFAEQVTDEDTIYEIRYDFDLNEESVEIPAGCVLKFKGGSITGGTVIFNKTEIDGPARIFCDFSGSIKGVVDCDWFGAKSGDSTFDNGAVINKVAAVFKDIQLNPGTYYFSTPIVLTKPNTITFIGKLLFNGNVSGVSLVTITSGNKTSNVENANIRIQNIEVSNTSVNYTDGSNSNCIGIDFVNGIACDVFVGKISGPNTGFRIFGNGKGCCYNRIRIEQIAYFNYGMKLYQDNGGWANENTILGVRFQKISDHTPSTLFPIYIAGPGTASDTYNHINNLSFNECCAEGFGSNPVMYMKNVTYCNVSRMRCENSNILAKFVGECQYNNFLDVGYGYSGLVLSSSRFDLSESTRNPFSQSNVAQFNPSRDHIEISTVGKDLGASKYAAVDGFAAYELVSNTAPSRVGKYRVSTNCIVGLQFDYLVRNDRYVTISSSVDGRVYFLPLEAVIDGQTITDFDTLKQYTPLPAGATSFNVHSTYRILRSGADDSGGSFYIPQPITKFFIGFDTKTNCTIDFLVNRYYRSYQTYISRSGSTRPTSSLGINDVGFEFFDTDDNMPIYWTGSGWVDATGTSV